MDFYQLAKARYSVRKFDGRHVKKSKLNAIMEAGRIAPTAKNLQALKIYVIESDEALEKINQCSPCIYGSKTVLMVCYDKDKIWTNSFDSSINSGHIDSAIVLTHMMLEAQSQGVNSCWVQFFDPAKAHELFNLPQNIIVTSLMPLGYATEDFMPSANHESKKELSELFEKI